MVKVGLIGLGMMGRTHLGAYSKNLDVEVKAVADKMVKKLKGDLSGGGNIATDQDVFDFSKVHCYEDAEELIKDKDLDIVDICLPTYLHADLSIKALEAGRHVLCEKPMARSLEECDKMIAASQKNNKKLLIGQCLRFWPEYEVLKDYVDNNKLGRLTGLFLFRGGATPGWAEGPENNWFTDKNKSGGALLDLHVHDVDMANYLLGIPEQVSSSGKNVIKGSGYDVVSTNYYYPDGPVVNAATSWLLKGDFGFKMSYLAGFEKGNIVYDSSLSPTIKVNLNEGQSFTPDLPSESGHVREINYFIKCVAQDKPVERVTPESARDSIKIALAEMRSIEENKPVVMT
ncbi:MAG: Gfo/Idh/MocA family oxidoreductase [Candidatus Omnitrophica bacterium]|nr:Gfo/Idh/MocA family oxidoreductase [Candidatus Omnitrophota bacterium]